MLEERRIVTILFADVTGSTELGESLDPEEVRALLSRYYTIAKDVVASHGGTIEKFIGDAVMAVFGLPQAHGDDVARALSAALELRRGSALRSGPPGCWAVPRSRRRPALPSSAAQPISPNSS